MTAKYFIYNSTEITVALQNKIIKYVQKQLRTNQSFQQKREDLVFKTFRSRWTLPPTKIFPRWTKSPFFKFCFRIAQRVTGMSWTSTLINIPEWNLIHCGDERVNVWIWSYERFSYFLIIVLINLDGTSG